MDNKVKYTTFDQISSMVDNRLIKDIIIKEEKVTLVTKTEATLDCLMHPIDSLAIIEYFYKKVSIYELLQVANFTSATIINDHRNMYVTTDISATIMLDNPVRRIKKNEQQVGFSLKNRDINKQVTIKKSIPEKNLSIYQVDRIKGAE